VILFVKASPYQGVNFTEVETPSTNTKQGVCHTVALPFTLKSILMQKKKWKFKYFTMQKYNLQENPLKEPKSSKTS